MMRRRQAVILCLATLASALCGCFGPTPRSSVDEVVSDSDTLVELSKFSANFMLSCHEPAHKQTIPNAGLFPSFQELMLEMWRRGVVDHHDLGRLAGDPSHRATKEELARKGLNDLNCVFTGPASAKTLYEMMQYDDTRYDGYVILIYRGDGLRLPTKDDDQVIFFTQNSHEESLALDAFRKRFGMGHDEPLRYGEGPLKYVAEK